MAGFFLLPLGAALPTVAVEAGAAAASSPAAPAASAAFRASRSAFFLAYDEENCDYLDLDGSLKEAMESGREVVSASFIIPYPPGFPILVPGQVISNEILAFMRALDVSEIHGYRPDLGLRVFTDTALAKQAESRLLQAAQ